MITLIKDATIVGLLWVLVLMPEKVGELIGRVMMGMNQYFMSSLM